MQRTRSTRRYVKNQKSWVQKCKDFIRQFVAFMFSNVGIIGLVIGYTIAGSFMFMLIEKVEGGEGAWEGVRRAREATVRRLWLGACCDINVFAAEPATPVADKSLVPVAETTATPTPPPLRALFDRELVNFQAEVVDAILLRGYEGEEQNVDKWTLPGAFLYSLTVITTIGYGNVAPKTEWGKLATILYAIVGMPLFLLYLSNIGDILAKSFKWTYAKCCLCKGCKSSQGNQSPDSSSLRNQDIEGVDEASLAEEESYYDPQAVTVPITLCLAIMVGYIGGGAVLFGTWENWSRLDGAYFCFISLSTIGFGDIVPGEQIITNSDSNVVGPRFIICSLYLMLGMALIAMCFNLMQEEVVHKIRSFGDTIRRIFRCNR